MTGYAIIWCYTILLDSILHTILTLYQITLYTIVHYTYGTHTEGSMLAMQHVVVEHTSTLQQKLMPALGDEPVNT